MFRRFVSIDRQFAPGHEQEFLAIMPVEFTEFFQRACADVRDDRDDGLLQDVIGLVEIDVCALIFLCAFKTASRDYRTFFGRERTISKWPRMVRRRAAFNRSVVRLPGSATPK
jgi:hypothetical protein